MIETVERYDTKKSEWICKICEAIKKSKMLMQVHDNGLGHCPDVKELEDLCPFWIMLISQIMPFMLIVGKRRSA